MWNFNTVEIPFAEVGKCEIEEKGDENTMYLRGNPQACSEENMDKKYVI